MTHTAALLHYDKDLPLSTTPPREPVHAPFRPIIVPSRTNSATRTTYSPPSEPSVLQKPKPDRKTLRTFMFDVDGRLQDAKIDLTTGEVVPHTYKDYSQRMPKARRNPTAPDAAPFWMSPTAEADIVQTGKLPIARPAHDSRSAPFWIQFLPNTTSEPEPFEEPAAAEDKSRKKLNNGAKDYLQNYVYLSDAIADYPVLDNIISGASSLDLGGNTRGLNRNLLFSMLQCLDIISPHTVRTFTGHSTSHSEKVAGCLRIIVAGFMRALGPEPLGQSSNLT